jgi:hypothetical protein
MTGTIEALEDVQKQMAEFPDRKEVAVLIGMITDGLRNSPQPFESLIQINEELEKLGELDGNYAHLKTVCATLVKTGLDAESDDQQFRREQNALREGTISMSLGVEGYESVYDPDKIVAELFNKKPPVYHTSSAISPDDDVSLAGTTVGSESDDENDDLLNAIFRRRRVPLAG